MFFIFWGICKHWSQFSGVQTTKNTKNDFFSVFILLLKCSAQFEGVSRWIWWYDLFYPYLPYPQEDLPLAVSACTYLNVTPKKIKQNPQIIYAAQKMQFSIQDFFSKCEQIRSKVKYSVNVIKLHHCCWKIGMHSSTGF